jgi:hypothetical protein
MGTDRRAPPGGLPASTLQLHRLRCPGALRLGRRTREVRVLVPPRLPDSAGGRGPWAPMLALEPMMTLAAIARQTERIGLVATKHCRASSRSRVSGETDSSGKPDTGEFFHEREPCVPEKAGPARHVPQRTAHQRLRSSPGAPGQEPGACFSDRESLLRGFEFILQPLSIIKEHQPTPARTRGRWRRVNPSLQRRRPQVLAGEWRECNLGAPSPRTPTPPTLQLEDFCGTFPYSAAPRSRPFEIRLITPLLTLYRVTSHVVP